MLTPEQLRERRKGIGSSDSAAIMGLSPWRDALDIWLDKCRGLHRPPGKAARLGTILEGPIMDLAQTDKNLVLSRHVMQWHDNKILLSNFDALAWRGGEQIVLEAKTTGIVAPADEYPTYVERPGGSVQIAYGHARRKLPEIPDDTMIQCQHHLLVSGLDVVLLACLRGGRGMGYYEIERDGELIEQIHDAGIAFHVNHVLRDIPPVASSVLVETRAAELKLAMAA